MCLYNTNSHTSSAGEELAVFVEWNSHDTIGGVEGFLDAIAVVDIDVDVHHTGMHP